MNAETKDKISKVDHLILLTERKLKLLEELRKSILYENTNYTIDQTGSPPAYFLYNNKTEEIIKTGKGPIKSWIKLRNINQDDIFNPKNIIL